MEHFGHENLSLCVLSTFSGYHGRICPLLLLVLLTVFETTATQSHSKSCYIELPTPLAQKH